MELIGAYLKKIRSKKKIRLEKVSNELNISKNLLENIENDYFPDHINMVFLLGHIKSYAKYLEVDFEEVIDNFKIQTSYMISDSNEIISKPVTQNILLSIPKSFSFVSVIIITFSFYFLFVKPNDLQPNYAMTPDMPENLIYSLEKMEMNIALNKKNSNNIKNLATDKDIKLVKNEEQFITSSSVIASIPKNKDIQSINNIISLKFLNPTWIQLRDQDDKIILSKLMDQGDEYSYNIKDNLNLTAGNAGNIVVLLDGIVKGKAGKVGEVIESLIIDINFNFNK